MTPIRLTLTAVALGGSTFFVTTLMLDGAPPHAVEGPPQTAEGDRAAFVARVAAGLEDEPHARGRAPAAEAPVETVASGASEDDDIAAAARAALAAAGYATQAPAPPATVAVAASGSRPPAGPGSRPLALKAGEASMAAETQGWVAAAGSGPATLELRPMPRR